MAENETGEKTEAPTGRRMGQARSEGMIARSPELSQVLGLMTAFLLLKNLSPLIWKKLIALFQVCFTTQYFTQPFTLEDMRWKTVSILLLIGPEIALLLALTAFVGAGSTLIQTNFNWSSKLYKPRLSKLNPIAGIRRLFSIQNSIQILKSLVKLAIIGPIAYSALFEMMPQLIRVMDLPLLSLLPQTGQAFSAVFWPIMKLMFVLSILDYCWQRYRVDRDLKMTKVEVKDERKATEGDERTRMAIRAKALQRVRQRMLKAVKTADVVVTNPTHIAVALQYTAIPGRAPLVVAKGQGHLAERIKEIARTHRVPVIERKPVARALYKTVKVGQEIPYELYAAVAEILAHVYRLKGKILNRKKSETQHTDARKDRPLT